MEMTSKENCGVCGKPLVYTPSPVPATCTYCGREEGTLVACAGGHFVCDGCHSRDALSAIGDILRRQHSRSPLEMLELLMNHPGVAMHGPEHHSIVPAVIITAVKNSGYPLRDDALDQAVNRGSRVPGGWCGSHGVCGAAIGVGIAVSLITGATPLKGEERRLANEAITFTLNRLLDGHPRCCKRAARTAVAAAVDFLKEKMGISLPPGEKAVCRHSDRNRECVREACPYYPDAPA